MFARTSQSILSVILLFVVFAVATPAPAPVAAPWGGTPTSTITVTATATPTGSSGNCNTGPIQCCNQVQSANSGGLVGVLLGLLGIVVSPLDALVGLDCSPITVIGLGQGGCSATPVCCQNNNVGGLISVGCIPIIL